MGRGVGTGFSEEEKMKREFLSVVLSALVLNVLHAEEPVYFQDGTLKAAVEEALWVSDPTPTDMLALVELSHINHGPSGTGIANLTGLEHAINLQYLELRLNQISDASPLSGLTHLQYLSLCRNQITDISPLVGLTSLTRLDLRCNPWRQQTCEVCIPQIMANNPGIAIEHDCGPFGLTISAGEGGTVVQPGKGEFIQQYNDSVYLRAQADPGFVFTHWSGTIYSTQNPYYLVVRGEHQIVANFVATSIILHVNDDAPDDPAPRDADESDPQEDGTAEHPFDRIQEAVDAARDGDAIRVYSGTYLETIDLLGKSLHLTGIDSNDPNRLGWPVIDGNGSGPVVSVGLVDNEPKCTLTGFLLTGGKDSLAAAVYCSAGRLTLANCLIVGNRASDPTGAIVSCQDCNAVLVNCTIADNQAGDQGAALSAVDSNVSVLNSILWGNTPDRIIVAGTAEVSACYSNIAGVWTDTGCIHADPLFAREGYWADPDAIWVMGDYHLQSETGRWDPDTGTWVQDSQTSPCIDAGDPSSPVGQEPLPNAGIINQGVYGGTAEASKSLSAAR